MTNFSADRLFVDSIYGGDAHDSYGGNFNNASSSSNEENELAEWLAIREAAKRAAQYEDKNTMQSPDIDEEDYPGTKLLRESRQEDSCEGLRRDTDDNEGGDE